MFKANLFELAEKRLIREKYLGVIPCYTMLDIIDYAVEIRKFLDHNPPSAIKKIMTLTKKELKTLQRKEKYIRTGY
jgi:hypothetical protein